MNHGNDESEDGRFVSKKSIKGQVSMFDMGANDEETDDITSRLEQQLEED